MTVLTARLNAYQLKSKFVPLFCVVPFVLGHVCLSVSKRNNIRLQCSHTAGAALCHSAGFSILRGKVADYCVT